MSQMTDYLETSLLDHVFRATVYTPPSTIYVGLFTSPPADNGSGTEVAGGSYARQGATFGGAKFPGGITATNATVVFAGLPATTVTHLALFDAATAGNMLMYGPLSVARTTGSGDTVSIAAGDLTVTFS